MTEPTPLPHRAFFSEHDDGASHLEYWSGFLFIETMCKVQAHEALTAQSLLDTATNCAKGSLISADVYLKELEAYKERRARQMEPTPMLQMIEALRFYADPENWETPSTGFAVQYDPEPDAVGRDKGEKARAVLHKHSLA